MKWSSKVQEPCCNNCGLWRLFQIYGNKDDTGICINDLEITNQSDWCPHYMKEDYWEMSARERMREEYNGGL